MTTEQLEILLKTTEGKNLEYKEAKNSYSKDDLLKYLCALANTGGGYFILGVTDSFPHEAIGTRAFLNIRKEQYNILQTIASQVHVEVHEVQYDEKRLLVFQVSARSLGRIVSYDKRYWCRRGSSIDTMDEEEIQKILISESSDFTAQYLEDAILDDIDEGSIELMRKGIIGKSSTDEAKRYYSNLDKYKLLESMGLIVNNKITCACILLVGKEQSIPRLIPQSEIIFEYRKEVNSIKYTQKRNFKKNILTSLEEVWVSILPYIEKTEIQVGANISEVSNFPERSVREAILNAICHRNYFNSESVVVKLNPKKFEVTSPGSLPEGVTPKNIVDKQARRNRLLAEVLEKCGLIERSGLGVDLMIESAVYLGQNLPVFDEPDGRFVHLVLHGSIDKEFSLFMNGIDKEVRKELSINELIALDYIRRNVPVSELNPVSIRKLMELSLIKIDDFDFAIPRSRRTLRKYGYIALREIILRELNIFDEAGCSIKYLSSVTQTPNETMRKILFALRDEKLVENSRGRSAKWIISNAEVDKELINHENPDVKPLDGQILDSLYMAGSMGINAIDLIGLISEPFRDKILISKMLKQMRLRRIIYSSGKGPGTRWYAKPRPEQSGQLTLRF